MKIQDFSYVTFVTGNPDKAIEVQALLPGIKIAVADLPEIQEVDSKKIITAKVCAAFEHQKMCGPLIVDDTSFYLDCLGGQLPGPLVKWFLETIKNKGLAEIAYKFENYGARASTMIGYAIDPKSILFFEGSMRGTITLPQAGIQGHGWSAIFVADGFEQIYATMSIEEKNKISMRSHAIKKLKEYLQEKSGL